MEFLYFILARYFNRVVMQTLIKQSVAVQHFIFIFDCRVTTEGKIVQDLPPQCIYLPLQF